MKAINERRSIRNFTNQKVEDEKIEALLRAGMQAPSARNQLPWEFVVVRDKETLKNLSLSGQNARHVENCDVAIVLLVNNSVLTTPLMVMQDMGACTQNILLEAVEQNLGAVWIGIMPHEERMEAITNILELPKSLEPFCIVAVGYSDSKNTFIDRYDKSKVHYEKFHCN